MSRPTMRFVPVKTAEQQAALMMVALRDRLIRNRTQLSNAIRGYAAEFGFTAARGIAHIDPLLDRIQADENVPVLARELFAAQAEEYAQLQAQIAEVDAKLMAWHKADECSRRLAKIPGVGPIGAALLMMKTPAPEMFRSGRQFAAWIGLTPKDHSTAGKVRLGVITRAGDEALRSVLYQPPENLTPVGFPTGRKCDSMQHVDDSWSGQHVGNRDYTPRSEYFAVAGGGGADG
jgi:transposase